MSNPVANRSKLLVGALFFAAALLRLGAGLWAMPQQNGTPHHDQFREYVIVGARLLEQGTFLSPFIVDDQKTTVSSLMPPLYAALVAGVFGTCGIESPSALYVLLGINVLAGAATVILVFVIAGRLGGTRAALLAALIALANPILLGFSHLVWDTSLFMLGVALSVWWSLRLGDALTPWWHWLRFGLWLGLLALLNPALTLGYPILVLWPATRRWGRDVWRLAASASLVTMGWLVVITPWTLRNHAHFGEWQYVRGGFGHELWFGVCPRAGRHDVFAANFPLLNDELQQHVAAVGEFAYIKVCRRNALEAIKADPYRYARLCGLRAVDYWFGTVYTHRRPGESGWPRSPVRTLGTIAAGGQIAVVALALLIRRRTDPGYRWLLGLLLVFWLPYVATHMQIRYRAPVEPIIAILIGGLVVGVDRKPTTPIRGPT